MISHAVFLDRDGTINIDPGYLGDPEKVELYEGVPQGLRELKKRGCFKIVVISNQSGISRGLIKEDDVIAVNKRINELLKLENTSIDAFYFCPYHPDFDSPEKCECRKPSPRMIFQAVEDLDIDLSKSYIIGDSVSDIECGLNAGIKTILVKNTLNDTEINSLHNEGKSPNFVAGNFLEACDYIVKDFEGGD
ncbi:MAG: hypothetical protein A2V66_14375 [Ignavibacteria bacterium RBG_13_36_8]|nr:MAG: hypothetical protein A2V66_14375 [Ignavibacteria bacterium RBG_13_36_8]